ncbi:MAG TPA: DUF1570 domain-containing protein [Gemmataceae bacterium]
MKRWLIAVAILVGGTASFSYADYVLIRNILGGKSGDPNNPNNPQNPAGPGGPRGPGGPPPGGPRGPGGPGRPGGPPTPPGGGDDAGIPSLGGGQISDIDTAALFVQGVVEFKHKAGTPPSYIHHKWSGTNGSTRLFNDNATVIARNFGFSRTLHETFLARKEAAYKGGRDRVLELARWALAHGLYDEFAGVMDAMVSQKEDQNNSGPQDFRDAVKAYAEVKAALEKPSEGEARANFWRSRLSARMETSKHYAVIYTSATANPPEVQSRLAALENHMRAFYYWFAANGRVLPVPGDKLVAVMLDTPEEFRKQRAEVEDAPLVSDGFYAHRDHICVFSSQRLDAPFQVFERQVDPIRKQGTYEWAKLLDGTAKRHVSQTPPAEFARMMTLALLEKALEEEAERAAVTHEGTRQLLVGAGLLPRTVVVPQWAEFGSAAVFETPKGPFPGAPVASAIAIFPGVASPSWAYLRPFKEEIKQMEEQPTTYNPSELLKAVVTDRQFNQVISFADRKALYKARTFAWAAAYYLLRARTDGMLKYYAELSALPRDLEMDDKTLLACFARAFDVANATQDGIDPAKFEQLAKDWVSFVKGLPIPAAELGLERELGNQTPPGGTPGPGGPERPGGRSGPGGGNRPGGGGGPGGGRGPGGR